MKFSFNWHVWALPFAMTFGWSGWRRQFEMELFVLCFRVTIEVHEGGPN